MIEITKTIRGDSLTELVNELCKFANGLGFRRTLLDEVVIINLTEGELEARVYFNEIKMKKMEIDAEIKRLTAKKHKLTEQHEFLTKKAVEDSLL